MTVDPARLRSLQRKDLPFVWRADQSALYALSVGFGRDDTEADRNFLLPSATQLAIPSMASVMTVNVFEQDYGWDYQQMLHGEQYLKLFRPIQPQAELLADFSVDAIHDKGANRPLFLVVRTDVRQALGNVPVCSLRSTLIGRSAGGIDGPQDTLPIPRPIPDRGADLRHQGQTRPEQAYLYRLNGDHNPLHVDPARARAAGFQRPILHGLCSYGFACRAILETICQFDPTLIAEFNARFSAPVYAGDTITTLMWQSGEEVLFQCRVDARSSIVIDNGYCRLAV
ncbi:MAG: MaoC/PaaZ C-terminal domain-containing protein [Pseudomonadota bacterium]